ncbi:hypothetical protein EI94DRAFT_1746031, partial [Lactarius quietus]
MHAISYYLRLSLSHRFLSWVSLIWRWNIFCVSLVYVGFRVLVPSSSDALFAMTTHATASAGIVSLCRESGPE